MSLSPLADTQSGDLQTSDAQTSLARPKPLAVQAAISWLSPDGSLHSLCHSDADPWHQVIFDVFFDAASTAALFRVRVPIALKACPTEKTPVYLYVHADRIETLSCDISKDTPQEIQHELGAQPTRLRLGLNKPADMIVPQIPLVPARQKPHGDRLDMVKLLAQATSWDVYVAAGDSTLDALLDQLCAAIAERGLRLLPAVAALSTLYAFKGGKVLGDSDLATTSLPPPSYDALEPGPPSDAIDHRAASSGPLKRRREHGDEDIEATCIGIVERALSKYRDEERRFFRDEMKRFKTEMLACIDSHVQERVQELEDAYTKGEVDGMIEQVRTHNEDMIEQVRTHNEDMIDVKLDDRMDGLKVELEEYVQDQFEGVEERMIERLRMANVSLDIAD